jgi:putative ABC transport system permease protein
MLYMAFRIALRALGRNKLRSFLTMLGIIIGVGAVIAMLAIGSGAQKQVLDRFSAMGTNLLIVMPGERGSHGVMTGSQQNLTLEDAQAIVREIPTIGLWTPGVRGRAQLIAGNSNWNSSIEGGNEDFLAVRNFAIAEGANFTARDVLVAEKVCLLGATVATTLFPDQDPIGQVIRVRNMPFRVLGVLAAKGQGQWGQDQDDFVVAPWTTVQKKLLGINYIHQVSFTARTSELVEPTAVAITRLMRVRHRSPGPEQDDFSVRTVEEMAATRVHMASTMHGLLMSVASVSLLVGGIGIMNIMLVSVTERTREIGVRMAVGAKTGDVLKQFLAEAVALSLVGGLAGIVLGIGVSEAITKSLGWPVLITGSSIAIAFAFSAAVGIFFGWYPARKAANLDPIEALRYE